MVVLVSPTPIQLTNSNVPEENYPVWDSSTTYNSGDVVLVENLGMNGITKKYKSLQDSNTNHYPPDYPDWWQDLGATNKWKMFDEYSITQTENTNNIIVSFHVDFIFHLLLFNIEASSVTIKYYDPNTSDLIKQVTFSNLHSYVYAEWANINEYYYTQNLLITPQVYYRHVDCELTIEHNGSTAKCGLMIVGYGYKLGELKTSPRIEFMDYSRKETDDYGRVYLQQGNYTYNADIDLLCTTYQLDRTIRILSENRAKACAWILADDITSSQEVLLLYGFYKDFNFTIDTTKTATGSIMIEGLV